MAYAIIDNGAARELVPGAPVALPGDLETSCESVMLWTDEERAAHGIYPIVEPSYGPREYPTDTSLEVSGTTVSRVATKATRPVTAEEVVAERERRLARGFTYNFGDERGIHAIGTTYADMIGWDVVSKLASAAIALGQPGALITIVTNTGPATVSALEWQQILVAAATQFQQPIWAASFALQAMSPIPADYASDARWP